MCAVLLQSFTSRAQERLAPLVILVSIEECCPQNAWPKAEEVLLDELAAMYVKVERADGVAAGVTEQRANLGVIAKERGAVCAIMISREPRTDRGAVDLWTVDTRSESSVARHLSLRAEEGAQGATIAAIKAVEALRAGLQELDLHLEEPDEAPAIEGVVAKEPVVKKGPVVRKPVDGGDKDRNSVLGLGLAGVGMGSPGGIGGMFGAQVSLAWRPVRLLSTQADVCFSVWVHDIDEEGSRSSFDIAAFRAWAQLEFVDRGIFRPSMGIGAGPVVAWAQGTGGEDLESQKDRVTVAYLGGTVQLGFALTRWFRLRLGAKIGALLPAVEVSFAGRKVAEMGLPLIEGFAGAEVYFF